MHFIVKAYPSGLKYISTPRLIRFVPFFIHAKFSNLVIPSVLNDVCCNLICFIMKKELFINTKLRY
jgi:hypothetical protein